MRELEKERLAKKDMELETRLETRLGSENPETKLRKVEDIRRLDIRNWRTRLEARDPQGAGHKVDTKLDTGINGARNEARDKAVTIGPRLTTSPSNLVRLRQTDNCNSHGRELNIQAVSEVKSWLDYKLPAEFAHLHQVQHCCNLRSLFPQGWPLSTPGEQCRTQVPTSAGSGDLLPKLGEESAPPLVQDQRAAPHRSWQCYTVLVIVETKPLWCSVMLTSFSLEVLATKPAIKFLEHSPTTASQSTAVALFQSPTSPLEAIRRWLCLPKQGFGSFSQGNRHLLAGLSCSCSMYIKASKNGTSDLSPNTRGAQVWRGTKHRPC